VAGLGVERGEELAIARRAVFDLGDNAGQRGVVAVE